MKHDRISKHTDTQVGELQREIAEGFPDLTVSSIDSQIHIRGSFPIVHEGKTLDRYQIDIEWSDSLTEVPILRETGGRIPWIGDRHMSFGGMACLYVPEEWLIKPRNERTLTNYLSGPVRDYLLWQSLFEAGKPQWKDRTHNIPGLLDAYGEMLGFKQEATIRRCLEYLSREQGIKGHWKCPCGSGRRIRECIHLEQLRAVRQRVPRYIAKLALERLSNPLIR